MKELRSIINQYIEQGLYPGVEWKVTHKKEVFQGKAGCLNLLTGEPLLGNSLYRIWSMTKPVVSVVILQLIEEHKIHLDDAITNFLPQFSNLKVLEYNNSDISNVVDIKNMPMIKDLLSHTAGFSYNFLGDAVAREYDRVGLFHSSDSTLEEEINLLSTIPLLHQPSTKWVYSVSVDVLARIIEIVTEESLQTQLEKRIFKPLGMQDTGFSVTPESLHRLMTSYEYDPLQKKLNEPSSSPQKIGEYGHPTNTLTYARGGHGLFSSLDDYSKFAQMLLTGKTKTGTKIISDSMLKMATTNHLEPSFFPLEIRNFDVETLEENDLEPYGWGLGFRVMMDVEKVGNIGSVGEFGWAGAAATYFLVDPKNDLTAVLMTQVLGAENTLNKNFVKTIYQNLN
jgi:CubicO group peptidase (beta-lactamase class C family)